MQLHALLDVLRAVAPERLAEPWDKVGLQLGDPDQAVTRAMLCIDLTESVAAEARAEKIDLIVAYHPPIFQPLPALTTLDVKQRIILTAARHGMAIYSPHTALDAAAGGVNDWLAEGMGEGCVRPIRPAAGASSCKIVVFVPADSADAIRGKMAAAGAGRIGEYSECSFTTPGEGAFRGSLASNPTVGKAGQFERVAELRMEMICPKSRVAAAIDAMRSAHPYEEPAFDIYPLEPASRSAKEGQGRVVELTAEVTLDTLADRLRQHLGVTHLEIAHADNHPIRRVALCAGAGGSLLDEAGDIDAFITGEMRHHDVLAAKAAGIAVLLAGHTQTERPYLPRYRDRLIQAGATAITWHISRTDKAPTQIRAWERGPRA